MFPLLPLPDSSASRPFGHEPVPAAGLSGPEAADGTLHPMDAGVECAPWAGWWSMDCA
jgi:hypothetical protein